jgi:hypothetical protein
MTTNEKLKEPDEPLTALDEGRRNFIIATLGVGGLALLGSNTPGVFAGVDSTRLSASFLTVTVIGGGAGAGGLSETTRRTHTET